MRFWIGLSLAIICEVIGVTFLNFSYGLSKLMPATIAITFYLSSVLLYMWNTRGKEVGVVGALFAGLGTVIVLLVGFFVFDEKISTLKLMGVVLIMTGVASLSMKPKQKGVSQ
ncbi:DMT family transporter [Virgibacillus alimentarius]|uniref:Multidrug transporter EmrE-like cation transporter n=1 Tax=Virgibacillus alimentarius TaxID=698769 RepID=A0ABS4SCI6_9BACI|nr:MULTISPECIES: SMR family transporter [Virgibacillus]MBP2259134.1 multidrug transporter EmrE-like cation transporter [Virgibacillus alimentarius]HLR67711.1 SMR family transporter [Virgibacillus sp.]